MVGFFQRKNLAWSLKTLRHSRASPGHLRSAIFDAVCAVPILQVACCTVGVQNAFFFRVCRTCPGGGRKSKNIMSWETDVRGHRDAPHTWCSPGFRKGSREYWSLTRLLSGRVAQQDLCHSQKLSIHPHVFILVQKLVPDKKINMKQLDTTLEKAISSYFSMWANFITKAWGTQ